MKKVLKYAGICAFVFALVAFILMLATSALVYPIEKTDDLTVSGTLGIFGGVIASADFGVFGKAEATYDATWSAVIAFILIIVAMIILLAGFILPLLKIHALDKVAGILNLVAVVALIVAAIFIFIEVPCFAGVNLNGKTDGWTLGGGWVVAGILAIVGGVIAILPAIFNFIGKK